MTTQFTSIKSSCRMAALGKAEGQSRAAAFLTVFCLATGPSDAANAAPLSKVWVGDLGDGTYQNPILYADYSDPDIVRAGESYVMVASSFHATPGLPILTSMDLVNWRLTGHVFRQQLPLDRYNVPQHGGGAWAPSIRYHRGEFYVYWADPDVGIFLAKAKQPAGPWTLPTLVKQAKGWIDPCPFWDDDGSAYLVHAYAASRSGIKSILAVNRMSSDGTSLLDDGVLVVDGHPTHPTIEGPKLYKRRGFYYIAAPAGGVPMGWQLVLRSKSIYGPYEARIVLRQGDGSINGPHQGGWVDTPGGGSWFIHFQDRGVYGRVVHLQPMRWINDWPVIGANGVPVLTHPKPKTGRALARATPAESDEFNSSSLGLQWQWQANPQSDWMLPAPAYGVLRLFCATRTPGAKNLWDQPSLLLQKLPAPQFTATAKVTPYFLNEGERTGLVVFGSDYAHVGVKQQAGQLWIAQGTCNSADRGSAEHETPLIRLGSKDVYLRVKFTIDAHADFSYSTDGMVFTAVGERFAAKPGRWVGAKVGLFAVRGEPGREAGYANYDWFRIE